MNRAEARRIANDLAAELRELDQDRLRAAYGVRPRCRVVFGRGGVTYQVETHAAPEGRLGRDLRVTVTIDDGDYDAAGPVLEEFVVRAGERLAVACPVS